MVEGISREELKAKMDRGDDFGLVETLAEEHYELTHLPGAINLPPGQPSARRSWSPTREPRSLSTARVRRERSPRRPPVSWWPWATKTCAITKVASKTG